ncbi:MAG: WbqC family protein, partial [Cohaesibacteraceae bacterium]|nr:WbqC family protein [Cohaesibacteraceae bacterium]
TNGAQWLSVSVMSKGKRDQHIEEAEVDQSTNFLDKHLRAIEHNYRKAPHFSEIAPNLLPEFGVIHKHLADLNINFILRIRDILGIKTPVLRSSAMQGSGNKADLLLSLCQKVQAKEYVSPPGSKIYLDETDIFLKANLPVKYFQFQHPIYSQLFGEFLPYMSCVDMLFNCGEKSHSLISEGCKIIP